MCSDCASTPRAGVFYLSWALLWVKGDRWNSYAHRETLPLSHKQVLEMGSLQHIVGYKFLVVSQSLSNLEHSPHKHRGPKILWMVPRPI